MICGEFTTGNMMETRKPCRRKPRSSAATRNCCFRADMPDTEREFSSEKERNAVNGGAQAQGRFVHCKKYENGRGNSCDTQKAWYNENIVA